MILSQLAAQAHSNSYYSRSDVDLYSAANSAGLALFMAIQREHRGFFTKFDTTSIILQPGTQTYSMPADFDQLISFSERVVTTERWRPMQPEDIGDALTAMQGQVGWSIDGYGGYSQFSFDGPYLSSEATTVGPNTPQIYQTDISPLIDQTRMTEIAYVAKWLPILNANSLIMLPDEAYPAFLSLTSANLLDMNGDTLAQTYRARAMAPQGEVAYLLSWARQKQITGPPQVQLFGGGM